MHLSENVFCPSSVTIDNISIIQPLILSKLDEPSSIGFKQYALGYVDSGKPYHAFDRLSDSRSFVPEK